MAVLRTIAAIAGWLACVGGAAHAMPLAGPALVAVITLLHARSLADPLRQLRPVLVLGVVGSLLESAAIAAGAYVPIEAMRGTPFCPLWITALWINAAVFVQGVMHNQHGERRTAPAWLALALGGALTSMTAYATAVWLGAIGAGWTPACALTAAALYGALVLPAAAALIGGAQRGYQPDTAQS